MSKLYNKSNFLKIRDKKYERRGLYFLLYGNTDAYVSTKTVQLLQQYKFYGIYTAATIKCCINYTEKYVTI
jgi:hypothetical protein